MWDVVNSQCVCSVVARGLGGRPQGQFGWGRGLTQLFSLRPEAQKGQEEGEGPEGWVSGPVLLLGTGCPSRPLNGNVKVTRKSLGCFPRSTRPLLQHTLGEHPGHLGWATGHSRCSLGPGWVSRTVSSFIFFFSVLKMSLLS